MTNTEILETVRRRGLLKALDKQRAFLLREAMVRRPSACGHVFSRLEATGLSLDDYPVNEPGDPPLRCPTCGVSVLYRMGYMAGDDSFVLAQPLGAGNDAAEAERVDERLLRQALG